MAIKHVCDRCENVTNGHKIYFGIFMATDVLVERTPNWIRKKKHLCPDCRDEFNRWFLDNKNFSD